MYVARRTPHISDVMMSLLVSYSCCVLVAEMLLRSLSGSVSEDKVLLLIEKAHIVESVIDVVKLSGSLTPESKQKLTEYQGTHGYLPNLIQ